MRNKSYKSKKNKASYNLGWREYNLALYNDQNEFTKQKDSQLN